MVSVANDASLAISNTGRESSSTVQPLRDASNSNVMETVSEVTSNQLQPDTIAMTGYPEQAAPPIERERYEGGSHPVLSDLDTRNQRMNQHLQSSRSFLENIATRLLSSPSAVSSHTLSTISQSDTDSRSSSHAQSRSLWTSVRSTSPSSTNASSSTPNQAHTPTPQPEIPMRYVDKGKGKETMPDFRAIIANLRAAGKLAGPPPADYLVDSKVSRQGFSSDYRPSTPRGRMSEELSDIQRDLAGMHVDPQDDDDLYAVTEPSTSSSSREARYRAAPRGWRGQFLATSREKSLTSLDPGDGRSGSGQDVNEEEVLELYFNLQQRRYDSLEKGQRDKFDEVLARRAHAAATRHQGREEEPRRQRKGPASSLSAKVKLRKNKTVLNLTVGDLLRDKGRLLLD
ncbi:uncharacterized protein LAESUDRAFT_748486 [Laetiporus sulphureus 93-53]|uniref:Uncharacterized protein n=1 Tax=Laetiporus sulphureus 93-53 TaxID=1314785 RepID=A0A165FRS8_9APHY|nr:uncharacterized protein LAESUDRAFT_748486 [Laetiporus sulphureus 93-53]KZT09332.1 hypothetical protein LAESUDRAFT_748486 [Laetiporus sulphureus 93-53]